MKWDGKKISIPGMYEGIPLKDYHGDLCVGPSISSSGLRLLDPTLGKSPAHYWLTSYLNPDRVEPEDKSYLTLGDAVHTILLGQEGFNERFAVRPAQLGGSPWHGNRLDCKAWENMRREEGRSIITLKDFEAIVGMADSIQSHPVAGAGLLNGEIERSIVWKDNKTGVWLKSRPDSIPADSNMLADLKTIQESDFKSCSKSITDYGYMMQLALAEMGMGEVLGRAVTDHILVFVAKSPPYLVNVKPLPREYIDIGRRMVRRAIDIFAACLAENNWPGYPDDGEYVELPSWLRFKIDAEAEAKLIPTLEETR